MKYYKSRKEKWVKDEGLGQTERLEPSAKYSKKQHVSSQPLF